MTRVPRLSRGRHPTPGHGQCLLELVSTLAGEVWSDRPAAVHPVLASIARSVNDECTDDGRQLLLPFAAGLLHTTRAPVVDLVLHCTSLAGIKPLRGRLIAPTVVAHATRIVALRAGDRRDDVLHHLLADCLALCHDPTTNWWTNGTSDDQTQGVPRAGREGDRATGHADGGGTAGDPGRRQTAVRHDAHPR
ncbi:hypothetical protein ACFFQW_31600 [Umezawaea endophytica]|uniref:Uncharacterized protein n=1 Tax=Umezawaea endophytica TaxID=1654476 RepID=A0A9X3A747_9PSEU|nr:hypothetical protein [Umezawaea endophytica]MCS7484033.1 hypothetical protein [Umezawaea endophytica]